MYNNVLWTCLFYMIIENHTEESNTLRFYSKISDYFVTVIMKRLVWLAVSGTPGSLVQKAGGGGTPTLLQSWEAGELPPGLTGSRVPV